MKSDLAHNATRLMTVWGILFLFVSNATPALGESFEDDMLPSNVLAKLNESCPDDRPECVSHEINTCEVNGATNRKGVCRIIDNVLKRNPEREARGLDIKRNPGTQNDVLLVLPNASEETGVAQMALMALPTSEGSQDSEEALDILEQETTANAEPMAASVTDLYNQLSPAQEPRSQRDLCRLLIGLVPNSPTKVLLVTLETFFAFQQGNLVNHPEYGPKLRDECGVCECTVGDCSSP